MTITLRAGVLNSGIQQNGTEFLTVDTSNNATLSNNLTVTGVATLGAGAVLGTPTSGNLANCTGYPASGLVGSVSGALTSGTAVATTSGTSIDFTSIPSWVKRITVMLNGVSTVGTSLVQVQIGDGAIATTGYVSDVVTNGAGANSTTGFLISYSAAAIASVRGHLMITRFDATTWIYSVATGLYSGSNAATVGGGGKTLSGTLDRIRLTTVNGTDTFDAGSVNILYE